MLQMMFEDLTQLNGGNLNLLLENENTLDDITTTFSVTMAQNHNIGTTANSQTSESNMFQHVDYQQNYSPNNTSYTVADFQPSIHAVTNARYQPYSTGQRPGHCVPDHRRYQNASTYLGPSTQYNTVPSTQVTYVTGVNSHQTVMPSVCRLNNFNEETGHTQQWSDQIPPVYFEQCNSNVNNNNSTVNHPGFTDQCQNNSGSRSNQLPYTQQSIYQNYYIPDQQKGYQNIHYSGVNQAYNTMSQVTNPSSPIETKKKNSPETKKKNKKRKKKGVNEPQKPVSAYALFFRDTQAAIKAENASASFGEISKIVASMWDTLSEDAKQVYKQKTETAKRDYLKQLAMFKANTISMESNIDADDEDAQPLSVLREKMASSALDASPIVTPSQVIDLTNAPNLDFASPPIHQPSPEILLNKCDEEVEELDNSNKIQDIPKKQSDARSPSPTIAYKQIIVTSQKGCQGTITILSKSATDPSTSTPVFTSPGTAPMKRIVLTPIVSPATSDQGKPSPIQLRNIVSKSPVTIIPSKQGQVIKVLPPGKVGTVSFPKSGNMIKLNMLRPISVPRPRTPSPPLQVEATTTTISHTEVETINSEPEKNYAEEKMEVDAPELPKLQMRPHQAGAQVKPRNPEINKPKEPSILMQPPPNLKVIPRIIKPAEKEEISNISESINMEIESSTMDKISAPNVARQSPLTIMLTTELDKEKKKKPDRKPVEVIPPPDHPRQCVRNDCRKPAVVNPGWDGEYCGVECVAKHCRDVMNAWTSARQVTASLS